MYARREPRLAKFKALWSTRILDQREISVATRTSIKSSRRISTAHWHDYGLEDLIIKVYYEPEDGLMAENAVCKALGIA